MSATDEESSLHLSFLASRPVGDSVDDPMINGNERDEKTLRLTHCHGQLNTTANLEVCSLSVNKIQSLRPFASCSRLRELYLRKNSIRNLEEIDHLAQLPELKVLWLADNPVAELPQYKNYVLGKLPGLQRLDSDLYGGGGAGSQNTGGGAPSARGEGGTATNQLHFVPPPSSARLLGYSGGASSSGAGSALGASGVGGSQSSAATKRPLKQRRII